jgi:hypothetical protein
LIDVPEDLLYNAVKGPNFFGEFFGKEQSDAEKPNISPNSLLFSAEDFDLYPVTISNSGAVYMDTNGEKEEFEGAGFDNSRVKIKFLLEKNKKLFYPITHLEEVILLHLKDKPVKYETLFNFVHCQKSLSKTCTGDWNQAINRLKKMGVLLIDQTAPI